MVGELVTKLSNRKCFTLSEFDTLKTASEKLRKYNVGAMPILSKQNNDVIGIVSERDIARFICKDEFNKLLTMLDEQKKTNRLLKESARIPLHLAKVKSDF